jgi:hypothetical protein
LVAGLGRRATAAVLLLTMLLLNLDATILWHAQAPEDYASCCMQQLYL